MLKAVGYILMMFLYIAWAILAVAVVYALVAVPVVVGGLIVWHVLRGILRVWLWLIGRLKG